jgi:hypothetical protein
MRTSNPIKDVLHNGACPDTAIHIVKTLRQLHFKILKYPPYSPDLAQSDYPTLQKKIGSGAGVGTILILHVYFMKIRIFLKCTVKINGSVVVKVRVTVNLKPSLSERQSESYKVVQQFLLAFIPYSTA